MGLLSSVLSSEQPLLSIKSIYVTKTGMFKDEVIPLQYGLVLFHWIPFSLSDSLSEVISTGNQIYHDLVWNWDFLGFELCWKIFR